MMVFEIVDIPTVKDCAQTKKRKREEVYENNVQEKRARLELLQDRCLNEKDIRKRTVLEQSTTRLSVTIAHTEAKLKKKNLNTTTPRTKLKTAFKDISSCIFTLH